MHLRMVLRGSAPREVSLRSMEKAVTVSLIFGNQELWVITGFLVHG